MEQLPYDVLEYIYKFCDEPTLATLCVASKTSFNNLNNYSFKKSCFLHRMEIALKAYEAKTCHIKRKKKFLYNIFDILIEYKSLWKDNSEFIQLEPILNDKIIELHQSKYIPRYQSNKYKKLLT